MEQDHKYRKCPLHKYQNCGIVLVLVVFCTVLVVYCTVVLSTLMSVDPSRLTSLALLPHAITKLPMLTL